MLEFLNFIPLIYFILLISSSVVQNLCSQMRTNRNVTYMKTKILNPEFDRKIKLRLNKELLLIWIVKNRISEYACVRYIIHAYHRW